MPERWQRHDLLRVKPEAWSEMLGQQPQLAGLPHVADWATRGWPLVVRRRLRAIDPPGEVPLGLPLPPECGKQRLTLRLPHAAIRERVSPPTLRDSRGVAPRAWRPAVRALLTVADETGVEPRVFGGLLWRWLTGLPYLSKTSDLDLLWPAPNLEAALDLVERLAVVERHSPVRFDGEILLPDGDAVQWRELHAEPAEVLVKADSGGVHLRTLEALFPPPQLVFA